MVLDKHIFEGNFGLERETLRVTSDGSLAQTPHIFDDEMITRDFCENQIELVSPVCKNIDELFDELSSLDKRVRSEIAKNNEYLWLNSNPPHFEDEDDIPIADFYGESAPKREYREKLAARYGKRLMLYCGIHFNFSFSDIFLKSLCDENEDYTQFKNNLYFRLFKQICRYSWVLVLLTASSPVYDMSLDEDYTKGDGFDGYASRRSSNKGYWNKFVPIFDCTDLYTYIKGIEQYVKNGALFSEWELYVPARLKPPGVNSLKNLKENGVNHIELRMFDVNPLSPLGIFKEDIKFAHYLLIYLAFCPDFDFTSALQERALKNHKAAALYNMSAIKIDNISAYDAVLGILDDMSIYFKTCPDVLNIIEYQKNKLTCSNRYCEIIQKKLGKNFHNEMLKIAKNI